MKILVVSDSHGQDLFVAKALDREWPIDAMLHLGDSQEDQEEFACILAGEDVPLYMVRGNCDYDPSYPLSRIVELAGHRILMTHGHLCSVSYGTQELARQALENECDIAIFGHTHRPKIDDSSERLLILNPGSITFPRQEMRKRSYMFLKLEKGKRPEAELRYV